MDDNIRDPVAIAVDGISNGFTEKITLVQVRHEEEESTEMIKYDKKAGLYAIEKLASQLSEDEMKRLFPSVNVELKYAGYARYLVFTEYGKSSPQSIIEKIQQDLNIATRDVAEGLFDVCVADVRRRLAEIEAAFENKGAPKQ